MTSSPRRIRSESERLKAGKGAIGDPIADLVVFYLDRLFDHVKLSEDLFRAAMGTLDDASQESLFASLFPGRQQEECGSAIVDTIMYAMDLFWTTPPRRAVQNDPQTLDPSRVEVELRRVFVRFHADRDLVDPFGEQRGRLGAIFGLSDPEIEILALLYSCASSARLKGILDGLSLPEFHRALAECIDASVKETKELLSAEGRLTRMGFIAPDNLPPPHFSLGEDISRFFGNPDTLYSFVVPLEKFFAQGGSKTVSLEGFPVSFMNRKIIESILRGGNASILIHGEPGTGKTTFVTTLLREQGIPAFILSAVGGGEDGRPPLLRLKVASHLARNAKAVLVVDEAEALLDTESHGSDGASLKAWLTEFMDFHCGAIVWIANDASQMHDAVKRRFVYSLKFRAQTERQRGSLWRELVRGYGLEALIGTKAIEGLSKGHEVNAGGIDIALRGLQCVLSSAAGDAQPGENPLPVLSEILGRHEALMRGRASTTRLRSAHDEGLYSLDAINVDAPLPELVAGLSRMAERLRRRHENAQVGAMDEDFLEAKLLFSGGSGTGKTAFASYLAAALGLPLVKKRASDLLSALVGGTEQLIAAAFEEAQEEGAILLLDESDSLFIDRRHARQSWERSQTNELLTRMEDFSGILICCTNRREDFDQASMRRFQWKLVFSPPLPGQALDLYRLYFGDLCGEIDEPARLALEKIDGICPGDFATVRTALLMLQSPGSVGPAIAHAAVISRLRDELECRDAPARRRIGFAHSTQA